MTCQLPAEHEAIIEMRRSAQTRIYREYRKKHCDKNGDQRTNLKPGEKSGIKSLDKRLGEQRVVVMTTDKSSKFCIATLEEYRKMGETHVAGDKKINREEMRQVESTEWTYSSLGKNAAEWRKPWPQA